MLGSAAKSRLHPELCEKIRELVANGEINAYLIRQMLRSVKTAEGNFFFVRGVKTIFLF